MLVKKDDHKIKKKKTNKTSSCTCNDRIGTKLRYLDHIFLFCHKMFSFIDNVNKRLKLLICFNNSVNQD